MKDEVKQAIEHLSESLEKQGLEKLQPAIVFKFINALITKTTAAPYTTEQSIPKIAAHLVKHFKLNDTIKNKAVLRTIFLEITALVTQMINEPTPANTISTSASQTPVRDTKRTTSTPATSPVLQAPTPVTPATTAPGRESLLFRVISNTPKMNSVKRANEGSSDEESEDDDWAVTPKRQAPVSKCVAPSSTPVAPEQPKSSTRRRTVVNTTYDPPQQRLAVAVTNPKDIQRLKETREKAALVEAQQEEQKALERQALSVALPKVAVVVQKTNQSAKKQRHQAEASKTSPEKPAAPKKKKDPRKLGAFEEKIDYTKVLRPRTRAATIQMSEQQAPAAVDPLFSTSPPFVATNNPPSPVQVSPRTPKRSPAATTTPDQSPKKPSPRLRTTSPKRTRTSLASDIVDLNETCSSISSAPRTPKTSEKTTTFAEQPVVTPSNASPRRSPRLSAFTTPAQTRMSLHQTPPAAQSPHTPVASRSPMAAPLSRTPRDIRSTSQIHTPGLSVTSAIPNHSVTPMLLHAYTPEHRSTRSDISSPAAQTPGTPATPKNAVSRAVVVIPPDEIMMPMGAPPFAQGVNVIEQPRQSPVSSPMATRYPIFLDTESPIFIRSRTRRQSSQPHTPVAVSFDVQTIVPMEQQQHALPLTTVIPNAEGLQSPLPARSEQASPGVLQFSPVHSRQSPRVSPRPRVHTPPHHSPVALAAPSPRRVSGVKRKSPIDSYQAKRNKYK